MLFFWTNLPHKYYREFFISSKDVLKNIKQLKNVIYIVSSNGENLNENKKKFHVKQEKFTINSTNIRHIDVINVKWRFLQYCAKKVELVKQLSL